MNEGKKTIDWERIESESAAIRAAGAPHGIEADVTRIFRELLSVGVYDERLPILPSDTVVYEMSFRFGRADIVVFHTDGSASVIEVKDGTRGYSHVVSGIGQASLYAVQLGLAKGALIKVRKCLLWTSAGSALVDAFIEETCNQANVIPLPWQSMASIMASVQAVRLVLTEASANG